MLLFFSQDRRDRIKEIIVECHQRTHDAAELSRQVLTKLQALQEILPDMAEMDELVQLVKLAALRTSEADFSVVLLSELLGAPPTSAKVDPEINEQTETLGQVNSFNSQIFDQPARIDHAAIEQAQLSMLEQQQELEQRQAQEEAAQQRLQERQDKSAAQQDPLSEITELKTTYAQQTAVLKDMLPQLSKMLTEEKRGLHFAHDAVNYELISRGQSVIPFQPFSKFCKSYGLYQPQLMKNESGRRARRSNQTQIDELFAHAQLREQYKNEAAKED